MKVIVILFLLIAGIAAWIYFVEPDILKRDAASAPAVTESGERRSGSVPESEPREQPVQRTVKKGILHLPDHPEPLYVNGTEQQGGQTLTWPPGPLVISARSGEGFVHERIDLGSGEEIAVSLRERRQRTGTQWSTFQGNLQRTGHIEARDRDTLEKVWQIDLGEDVESSPILEGTTALVATENSLLTALDITSGEVLWSEGELGSSVTPVTISGFAFGGSNTGELGAFKLDNGRKRGDLTLDGYPTGLAAISEEAILASTIANRVVSVKTNRRFTGRMPMKSHWETEIPELASGASVPVVAAGVAVYQTGKGLVALEVETGKRLWPAAEEGAGEMTQEIIFGTVDEADFLPPTPAIAEETVYAGNEKRLSAVTLRTGRTIWEADLPAKITSSVSLAHGLLYIGTADGRLEARSIEDGVLAFEITSGTKPILASPVLFADKVLIADAAGRLALHSAFSGARIASNDALLGQAVKSTPAVTDSCILVIGNKGRVVCFR